VSILVGVRRRRRVCRDLVLLFLLSVAAVGVAEQLRSSSSRYANEMVDASRTMQAATQALADHRIEHGPALDTAVDVNRTGLIGTLFSPMTTTVGNLEAKRTTTNPNMAALAVHLLLSAGVRKGDYIAVGGSGSFPAVIVAVLCAAKALDLKVGLIVSLGASQWGANLPDFTWLEMEDVLIDDGILPVAYRVIAASVGGDDDVGNELSLDAREALRRRISQRGVVVVEEPHLAANVAARVQLYHQAAEGRGIAAFVNVGGAWANLGIGSEALALAPGLNRVETIPPPGTRGVLFELAAGGVPVIHFLNIGRMASESGLPWDPSPLPQPGEGLPSIGAGRVSTVVLAAVYLFVVDIWLAWTWHRLRRRCTRGRQSEDHVAQNTH
jgi:poly-gamma-glutamate system protein